MFKATITTDVLRSARFWRITAVSSRSSLFQIAQLACCAYLFRAVRRGFDPLQAVLSTYRILRRRIGSIYFSLIAMTIHVMGIYDRDYMRDDDPADWWKQGYSIRRWLTIGIIAVSLLTSLFYFARTTGISRRSKRVAPVVARATPIRTTRKGIASCKH
jgi:hypothetical protein